MTAYSKKQLRQIRKIQNFIHYAPEKLKKYLRQIQQQEYLRKKNNP